MMIITLRNVFLTLHHRAAERENEEQSGGPVKTLKTWKSPDWWLAVAADDFHMSVKHCYNEQIAKVSQAQCQVASQIVPAECLRAQSVYSDLVKRQLVIIYLCFPLSKVRPMLHG